MCLLVPLLKFSSSFTLPTILVKVWPTVWSMSTVSPWNCIRTNQKDCNTSDWPSWSSIPPDYGRITSHWLDLCKLTDWYASYRHMAYHTVRRMMQDIFGLIGHSCWLWFAVLDRWPNLYILPIDWCALAKLVCMTEIYLRLIGQYDIEWRRRVMWAPPEFVSQPLEKVWRTA